MNTFYLTTGDSNGESINYTNIMKQVKKTEVGEINHLFIQYIFIENLLCIKILGTRQQKRLGALPPLGRNK